MKSHYILLSILFYSQFSFSMLVPYIASVKQTKTIVQMPKRTISNNIFACKCVRNFKPEKDQGYAIDHWEIKERIKTVNWIKEAIRNEKQLREKNLWPEKEGQVLSSLLYSNQPTYCRDFEDCACAAKNKSGFFGIGGPTLLYGAYSLATHGMYPEACVAAYLFLESSTGFYKSTECEKILSEIARKDNEHLDAFNSDYKNFYYAQKQLERAQKELEEKALEDQNKE